MKFKIKKKNPTRVFLLFPQYCSICMNGFWLQFVKRDNENDSRGVCPTDDVRLFFNKSIAIMENENDI